MTSPNIFKFPCDYSLKIIGLNNKNFKQLVVLALKQHIPSFQEEKVGFKGSRNKRYCTLTVAFYASSKAQINNLCITLTSIPEVIMTL